MKHINLSSDELIKIALANNEGKLAEHSKHRGRKKAVNTLISSIYTNASEEYPIYVAHTNCVEEALSIKQRIEEETNFKVETGYIDYTMGSHCGPKTIAVFYKNK